MKLKILFAGIDGSGKSACLDLLVSRLNTKYRILRLGNYDPYLYFRGEKHQLIKYNGYYLIEHMGTISRKIHLYGLFLVFNFIYKYVLSKYLQAFREADLILCETDTLLHPVVYATFHLPFTRMLNARSRFTIARALFGSKKNFLIFYLDTDPSIAVDRIRKRDIRIEPHENVSDLGKLKTEFDKILHVATQSGFEVVRINTNLKSMEEVITEVELVLNNKFHIAS